MAKPPSPVIQWLLTWRKEHPQGTFADARAAAQAAGHSLFPVVWGRALVMLGEVTARPAKAAAPADPPTPQRRQLLQDRASPRPPPPARPASTPPGRSPTRPRLKAYLPIDVSNRDAALHLVAEVAAGAQLRLGYDGEHWALVAQ